MSPCLIDTDILSFFLRGVPNVVSYAKRYLQQYGQLNLSVITYYEILSGLRYKDASKQLDSFHELVKHNRVLPLTTGACEQAADIYALYRRQGQPLDDIDVLIAGIALDRKLALATHNSIILAALRDWPLWIGRWRLRLNRDLGLPPLSWTVGSLNLFSRFWVMFLFF